MANALKNMDPAFQGVGQRIGTEIWRIENFQPVPLPKADYGKFYSGDSYIVLQTIAGKGGAYLYAIHFWLGKDTSQDEAGTAAIKTVELDAVLGGRAIQHRELQGHESDKFLSYFKPCIIPLEGGVASGFKTPEEEKFETRLYVCRGKRVVRLKQVPFSRTSLNHDDVFILDTENKIYQFNGANSNIQERAKALEVMQYLKDKYHDGTCDVAIIDDGKLAAESGSGEFWVLFGGFAPISKRAVSEDDITLERTAGSIYSITDGKLKFEEGPLSKAMLENNKCYLLDCGDEIFVWVGRVTQIEDRKTASKAAEEYITNQNRPKSTRITQVIQGFEPYSFKSHFDTWPMGAGTGASGGEDGRGKVAALLKQQGVGVKGIAKSSPVNEEVPPLLEGSGKTEVWLINGSAKTQVRKEDVGKFYSGDCYIVLHTYSSGEKKEEYFLSCWMGKNSNTDDQMVATQLANTMSNSLKGKPVQGRIFQGKEPPQFIALFQPMVVLKGGISSAYKEFLANKNLNDDTYVSDGIALIQISSTSVHHNKAVQVDAVAKSLCSSDCFLLQSGNSIFIWSGNSSTIDQQHWAAKVAEFLKPGVLLKHAKEGTESSTFWFALGGKQSYTSKKVVHDIVRDPHLYTLSFNKGKLEITEVFNFCQDDLLTEDLLILDTHAEVFVWVGHCVDPEEKQNALNIGQKYIELAVALEGLSPDVPLYKVTEGNEPCFFTTYFSWDGTKATIVKVVHSDILKPLQDHDEYAMRIHEKNNKYFYDTHLVSEVQGNSFQKKVAMLFGTNLHASESGDKSNNSNHSGATQRASALAALSSAFNPSSPTKSAARKPVHSSSGSQRAAAVAALSTVLTAEQKRAQSEASNRKFSSTSLDPVISESEKPEEMTDQKSEETDDPKIEQSGDPMSEELGDPLESAEEEGRISTSENNGLDPDVQDIQTDTNRDGQTFSYEQVKSKSSNPARGIDLKRRETYLSDDEFQTILGMTKEEFYRQPKWKQDIQKRKVDLF